jgi:hypothetical protein
MERNQNSISETTIGDAKVVLLSLVAALIVNKGGYTIDTAITRAQELITKSQLRGMTGAPVGGFDARAIQAGFNAAVPAEVIDSLDADFDTFDENGELIGD